MVKGSGFDVNTLLGKFDEATTQQLAAIIKAANKIDYTEHEKLFIELVENEEESHKKMAEIYSVVNPKLFAIFGDKKDKSYYYQDFKSGIFIEDVSKGVYLSGIDKLIKILQDLINKIPDLKEQKKFKTLKKQLGQKQTLNAIYELLVDKYFIKDFDDLLDSKMNLVGFNNGVYDLETGKFRRAEYNEYVSKSCGYDFPEKDIEKYEKIKGLIKSMFKTNDDYKAMMFQLAYFLDGNKKFETVHFWTGVGSNGKTLLMNLIEKSFGEYFGRLKAGYFTNYDENSSQASPDLVALKGIRVVNTDEASSHQKLLIHKMKRLTTSVDGRNLYSKKMIKFMPQFASIIQANDMPELSEVDDAIGRRLQITRFPFTFKTLEIIKEHHGDNIPSEVKVADVELLKNISKEELYKQFMILLIEEYSENVKNAKSYYKSEDMKTDIKEYLDSCNPVLIWFNENYIRTNNTTDRVSSTDLYNEFKRTGKDMTSTKFGRYMNSMGIQKLRLSIGFFYTNIKEKLFNDDN